jgi:hypothetical protein
MTERLSDISVQDNEVVPPPPDDSPSLVREWLEQHLGVAFRKETSPCLALSDSQGEPVLQIYYVWDRNGHHYVVRFDDEDTMPTLTDKQVMEYHVYYLPTIARLRQLCDTIGIPIK